MIPDDIERVALAIATCRGDVALRNNIAEINQADQFDRWRALYPIKVTDYDRLMARAAIEAMPSPREVIE